MEYDYGNPHPMRQGPQPRLADFVTIDRLSSSSRIVWDQDDLGWVVYVEIRDDKSSVIGYLVMRGTTEVVKREDEYGNQEHLVVLVPEQNLTFTRDELVFGKLEGR